MSSVVHAVRALKMSRLGPFVVDGQATEIKLGAVSYSEYATVRPLKAITVGLRHP